jgi:glutamate racemase
LARPLIGITAASFIVKGKPYHRGYAPNVEAVAAAGGLPVYVPPGLDPETLRDLYDRLDGLLLPGGPDVRPTLYGQAQHPMTLVIDDPRDALELTLARWAAADELPVLGICRGHQVLNVALGGTLVQDIPSQVPTTIRHDQPDGLPRSTRLHEVTIAAGSRLASILGETRVSVNSLHHQSPFRPARRTAWSRRLKRPASRSCSACNGTRKTSTRTTRRWRVCSPPSWPPRANGMSSASDSLTRSRPPLPDGFVAVFDSGVGGLTILREIQTALPRIPTVYYADQAHMPYGPQPAEVIHGYVEAAVRWLIERGAAVIVLACHSASATSLYRLRETFPYVPFVGLEPAVKPAAEATHTGVVGVLSTQVTAEGELYRRVVERHASHIRVITQPAPELVLLVEHGTLDGPEAHDAVARALEAMNEAGADQLVLACTHFPFLAPVLRQHTKAALVDPSQGVTKQTARLLPPGLPGSGDRLYLTSGDPVRLTGQLHRLLGEEQPLVFQTDVAE